MECLNIDFDVLETNNPKKLMVGDTSPNWLHAEDKPAYLYITLPGSKREHIFTFKKGGIQVYNSNNLGLSDIKDNCSGGEYVNLPDGIYKLKLQSGYEEHYVDKYYLKTDIIEKEVAKSIVRNALNPSANNQNFRDKMFEVDWKLRVAKSFMMECNINEASTYYNEAVELFKSC